MDLLRNKAKPSETDSPCEVKPSSPTTEAEKFLQVSFAEDDVLNFARKELVRSVAAIAHGIGFSAMQCSALVTVSDLLEEYMKIMFRKAKEYSELADRSMADFEDVIQVCRDLQVDMGHLNQFARRRNPIKLPVKCRALPEFPVKPEKMAGWDDEIPACFYDNIPKKEDVEVASQAMLEEMKKLAELERINQEAAKEPEKDEEDESKRDERNSLLNSVQRNNKTIPDFLTMSAGQLGYSFSKKEKKFLDGKKRERSFLLREEEDKPSSSEEDSEPSLTVEQNKPPVPEEDNEPPLPEEKNKPSLPEEEREPSLREEEKPPQRERLILRIKRHLLPPNGYGKRLKQGSALSKSARHRDLESSDLFEETFSSIGEAGMSEAPETPQSPVIKEGRLSTGSRNKIPLAADELCMVSDEISEKSKLPNIVIRINRRLMEEHVRKAAERNATPPPERVKVKKMSRRHRARARNDKQKMNRTY
uniref:BTP domain-containing protein n=1 Tax=Steinernema glaseri TaxID=37863 RepID=A0A1I7ZY53_9BILA